MHPFTAKLKSHLIPNITQRFFLKLLFLYLIAHAGLLSILNPIHWNDWPLSWGRSTKNRL